jgi:hypothetical protein
VKKYGTAGLAEDDNMAHALCNAGYLKLKTHTQNM